MLRFFIFVLFVNGQEYIIRYNGYFNAQERTRILDELSWPFERIYRIEKRNVEFSDFDLISSNNPAGKHRLVKDLLPYKSSKFTLQSKRFTPAVRRRSGYDIPRIPYQIQADKLWAKNFTGNFKREGG